MLLPTILDFKQQFARDFPYASPLKGPNVGSGAVITPVLGGPNGDQVSSYTVTAGGTGFSANQPPTVIVYGGGGFGATAQATAVGGVITAVTPVTPGYGYKGNPLPSVYVSPGTGDNTSPDSVNDFDIANALNDATVFNVSQELLGSQAAFTRAYLLLAAHYLCKNLLASGMGVGGKAEWLTQTKTVGPITESFAIPDRILKSPILSKLSVTTYGAQFLEFMAPQLIGNFATYNRITQP